MDRIKLIRPLDGAAMRRSAERWNGVAKPLHSLGLFEDDVIKIAGITGDDNVRLDKRRVIVMCADHGVVSEGVTQTSSSVTAIVAESLAKSRSCVNLLAKSCKAEALAVDIGMFKSVKGVCDKNVARGTQNIAVGAAMTVAQAEKALSVGIDLVRESKEQGYDIIATGEMGIGNTTAASAVTAALTGLKPEAVTGRGAGLGDEALRRKIDAVERAVRVNKPDPSRPLELLAKVGGLDIAGIAGLFLGGAIYRLPVVVDGFISAAAAAIAAAIEPAAKDFMLCSHVSSEPASAALLDYIGLKAPLRAGMFLGEGAGAVMLFPLLDAALAVYNGAHRFDELPMERYEEQC